MRTGNYAHGLAEAYYISNVANATETRASLHLTECTGKQ
jgi:hypothetical protein